MWYASGMTDAKTQSILNEARLAMTNAQEARAYHRKRTSRGDRQRRHDLTLALSRVKAAMRPIRSAIGKFPHESLQTPVATQRRSAIREASEELQKERRKLWKMLHRPKKGPK